MASTAATLQYRRARKGAPMDRPRVGRLLGARQRTDGASSVPQRIRVVSIASVVVQRGGLSRATDVCSARRPGRPAASTHPAVGGGRTRIEAWSGG